MSIAATLAPQHLVETFSIDPRQLHEGKDGGYIKELADGRYRVRCKGQHCGVKNRNNRRYGADETWGKHTQPESEFAKRVMSRRVTGQLEHPPDGKSSMGLAAVVVTEVSAPDPDTGVVMVTFETMSTEPGRIVEAYIRDGVGFGLSSRGNGSVVRAGDGVDEVQGDFEPITFDCVIDESTPGAEVPSRLLKEAHAVMDRCYQRLMEAGNGDTGKARLLAEAESFAAIQRDEGAELADAHSVGYRPDLGGPQMFDVSGERGKANAEKLVGRGHETIRSAPTEYLLGLSDGSGHYRALLNGKNQWDVLLYVHNLEPEQIAADMRTILDAKLAAETHAKRIVRESYTVDGRLPYSGTMMTLRFDGSAEAGKAKGTLDRAGFNSHLKGDDSLCVYTSYEDPEQAEAHVLRVLGGKKIEPRDESFAVIRRGRIVWEDTMADGALLREINDKLTKLVPAQETTKRPRKPKMVERGMRYEDDDDGMYGDDDMEMENDEYGDDDEYEMEADDDEDPEYEEDPEEGYYGEGDDAMQDDPDVDITGSPEDIENDDLKAGGKGMTPESATSFIDIPRKRGGETVGYTRIFMDEGENVVGTVNLNEEPNPNMQAMHAKAFGTRAIDKKARKKDPKSWATLRHNIAVDKGLSTTAAAKGKRQLTKKDKAKSRAAANRKRAKGKKKSRKESVGQPTLAKMVEATATLLTSPYQKDVMAGLRAVNEMAADWPTDAQNYVLEALQALHQSLSDEGLASVVEAAAQHVMGDSLQEEEGDEHEFDIDLEGNLDEEDDEEDDDDDDGDDVEERLRTAEIENARMTELVAAQAELNQALAAESKVTEMCLRHPVLEQVRGKLESCLTAEDVEGAAQSYLGMVRGDAQTGIQTESVSAPDPQGTTRIASNIEGSLNKGPLQENIKPSLAGRRPRAPLSTSSRVAKYRRRQR